MPRETIAQAYLNPRMAVLAGLGFASGFPLLLTGDTLQAWLTDMKVDVKEIGLFSLVTVPYALKFLWAPLMDRYMPPLLGRRRGWLLVTQILLALAILGMAACGSRSLTFISVAALAVAFLSASQDIVSDAYRTDVLPEAELGTGSSVFVTGYRAATIAAGAGMLILAGGWASLGWKGIGWERAYMVAAGVMALGLIATLLAPEADGRTRGPATLRDAVVEPLVDFAAGRYGAAVLVALFVVVFKLPSELAGSLTMKFLRDMKFTDEQIALVRQFIGLGFTIAGVLAGGAVVTRVGVTRSLWLFGVLQALSNAGFFLLAMTGPRMDVFIGVIAVENFCTGLVTAGFMAFLMSRCHRRYSATQYALLTGLMRLGGSLGGTPMGYLVAHAGYQVFFGFTILIAIPGMAMLPFLPPPTPEPLPDTTTDSTTIPP